jgi:hypothetical protein
MARAAAEGIDLGRALQSATQLVRAGVPEGAGIEGLYGLGPFVAWTG